MKPPKITMPKQTAELEKIFNTLIFYNKYPSWVDNDLYKEYISEIYPEKSDNSDIVKQAQVSGYYGFLEYINREKRITPLGKKFLSAKNDKVKLNDILLNSLNNTIFGKDNNVVPSSNSIVEPPKLFLRAIYELEYLTKFEFAFLIYKIHNKEMIDLTDIINLRMENYNFNVFLNNNPDKNNLSDTKIDTFFLNLEIITKIDNKFYLNANIKNKYSEVISKLDYVNTRANFKPTHDFKMLEKNVSYLLKHHSIDLKPSGNKNPSKKERTQTVRERDPHVIAAVKKIANGKCENCEKDAPFIKNNGQPYLEVHHVKRLADDGSDTISNAVAICPNCHRALHHSKDSKKLADNIIKKIDRLIKE